MCSKGLISNNPQLTRKPKFLLNFDLTSIISFISKGRRQSPINIEPSQLLYDKHLRPLHIDKDTVRCLTKSLYTKIEFSCENLSN